MRQSVLAVLVMCGILVAASADAGVVVTWGYTGNTFDEIVPGSNFSASDSITGTMSILDPPAGQTVLGIGAGPTQANIVDISFSASGVVPTTYTDLSNASSTHAWSFTFDGALNITDWALGFVGGPGNVSVLSAPNGSFALVPDSATSTAGGFSEAHVGNFNQKGSWQILSIEQHPVPEPGFATLGLIGAVGLIRRRRRA